MEIRTVAGQLAGWIFGVIIFAMGFVNTFWGNDPGLGIGLLVLSFVYYPPINRWIQKDTGYRIPLYAKIILGLLLLWVSLGVGELFGKIDLMLMDLNS